MDQAELNFYGYNPNNIIARQRRGKIAVCIKYDGENRFFVVTRTTPKTKWVDRYKTVEEARRRFWEYMSKTNKQLEMEVNSK